MPANFEKVHSFSRIAGADYSADAPQGGQYRFAVINPNPVTNYTPASNPGKWYGSEGAPVPIPAGNVLVNSAAGADCDFILMGAAKVGEPIECGYSGRLLIILGGTVAPGAAVSSDANGAAITHSGSNHILGDVFEGGVAGDVVSINFVRRGEA